MPWYALAIFLSAFLLFQVQPLLGKYILPWFGGTPSVWTTCMLFFQLMLVAGYSYAHLSVRRLSLRRQGQLHAALLACSIILLPIIPAAAWKPAEADDPTWRILILLFFTVGGPYFLLSATAPLLQSWFHQTYRASPFRLYALSNVASLLALFSYPLVMERAFRLELQAWTWSIGYASFAVIGGILALRLRDSATEDLDLKSNPISDETSTGSIPQRKPTVADVVIWICLAACGSMILLTTTNHLTQDVAAVPFLWVLPLALYLLTFVICFDAEHWYQRSWFNILLIAAVLLASLAIVWGPLFSLPWLICIFSFMLFTCCMTCHGELVRLKPNPRYLTRFYLMVAVGGAVGGIFVTFVAPAIFNDFKEFPLSLMATCVLAIVGKRYERSRQESSTTKKRNNLLWWIASSGAGFVAIAFILSQVQLFNDSVFPEQDGEVERRRNFYGVLLVAREGSESSELDRITMSHGRTRHGFQFLAKEKRGLPTAYYVQQSGVGLAINAHPKRQDGNSLNVGVIGLGCGTLSAYMNQGDSLRFYEINPDVVELSRKHFTFQSDAVDRGAAVDVQLGDARIVMEEQLRIGQPQDFDVLVVDAFSSDSIPVHLLTRECMQVYLQHLASDGILTFHVSNNYLNLVPVVHTLAQQAGTSVRVVRLVTPSRPGEIAERSEWVLCTTNERFLNDPRVLATAADELPTKQIEWTDNFSNLFGVLRQ